MKVFMKNFSICLIMVLIIVLLIHAIDFVFVSSYDENDNANSYKYCKLYSEENNLSFNELMNDFMYKGNKYYSCVLGKEIKLIYIFDNQGNYVIKKSFNKYEKVREQLLGNVYLGMYQDKPVIVEKYIEDGTLFINYYDFDGVKIFDVHGLEKEVEEMLENDTSGEEVEDINDGEKLVEE